MAVADCLRFAQGRKALHIKDNATQPECNASQAKGFSRPSLSAAWRG